MATETKKERKIVEIITARICDRCKRRSESPDWEFQEFIQIEWTCGYGSIMTDGDTYALDLCQNCVKELLEPHAKGIRSAMRFTTDADLSQLLAESAVRKSKKKRTK